MSRGNLVRIEQKGELMESSDSQDVYGQCCYSILRIVEPFNDARHSAALNLPAPNLQSLVVCGDIVGMDSLRKHSCYVEVLQITQFKPLAERCVLSTSHVGSRSTHVGNTLA